MRAEGYKQSFQSLLTFSNYNHVRACIQKVISIMRRFGPAEYNSQAKAFAEVNHRNDIQLRHQVSVDTDHRRTVLRQVGFEFIHRGERRIEDRNVEATLFQIRRKVEDAK